MSSQTNGKFVATDGDVTLRGVSFSVWAAYFGTILALHE